MTLARLSTDQSRTFVLLNFTSDGNAVLLDAQRRRTAFQESSARERVEVQCDRCGEWTTFAVATRDGWECYRHRAGA